MSSAFRHLKRKALHYVITLEFNLIGPGRPRHIEAVVLLYVDITSIDERLDILALNAKRRIFTRAENIGCNFVPCFASKEKLQIWITALNVEGDDTHKIEICMWFINIKNCIWSTSS